VKRFGTNKFLSAAVCLVALCFIAARSAQAQYSVVYSFAGAPNDGGFANGELTQDAAGNFYGTTEAGGTHNWGTIFKIDSSGNETVLYNFSGGSDGGWPMGGLLRDTEGNLYGTTSVAGTNGGGTVFEFDTSNTLRTIFQFGLATTGNGPRSRLVTNKGDLYGVTTEGGIFRGQTRYGIIYKVTKGGTETVLYSFTGGNDGARPQNLIRDSAGNLYGVATAASDTSVNAGTVWKLDTAGVFSVLYAFTGGADGGNPTGRLIQDTNGNIHGTTTSGGDASCNCGVVFQLDTNGKETVIHKFFGHGGGAEPLVGLLDVGGTLYGTAVAGGDSGCECGLVYEIGRTGQYTVLHRFGGAQDGDGNGSIFGALTLAGDGSIYSATWYGGTGTCSGGSQPGCGTIFKYTP
jgi:uncharacterized repeat protein (TIGR03803 family)